MNRLVNLKPIAKAGFRWLVLSAFLWSPQMAHAQSPAPFGWIYQYPGTPCTGSSCPPWILLGNDSETVRIAAADVSGSTKLYRLLSDGSIEQYTGSSSWTLLGNDPTTWGIFADGTDLYQLRSDGTVWLCSGPPSCTWQMLGNDPTTISLAADAGELYQMRSDGSIWNFTGPACSGSSCTGWFSLDSNPTTVAIAAGGGELYQLQSNGNIWHYTGIVSGLPTWEHLDNNPLTGGIVAGNALYQLHQNGSVFQYTGPACTGFSCPGWTQLDNNPMTLNLVAEGNNLYQMHNDGTIFQWTGGTSWVLLGNDYAGAGRIVATGSELYQLNLTRTPFTHQRVCFECNWQ